MAEKPVITYRRATHGDYRDVMNAHDDVYDGLDYLPVMYHIFLQWKKAVSGVAVCNGKVIGFSMDALTPWGEWLGLGGRITPGYQGQGVTRALTHFLTLERQRLYPEYMQRARIYLQGRTPEQLEAVKRDPGAEIVFIGKCITTVADIATLQENFKAIQIPGPCQEYFLATKEYTKADLNILPVSHCLPPYYLCENYWNPYIRANPDISRAVSTCRTLVTTDSSGRAIAISFSACIPSKMGTRTDLNFYSKMKTVEIMRAHLIKNYQHVCSIVKTKKVGCRVIFSDEITSKDEVEEMLRSMSFTIRHDSGYSVISRGIQSKTLSNVASAKL